MQTYVYMSSETSELFIVEAMSRSVADARVKSDSRHARLTLLFSVRR
jgi:hypothetical protein